MIPPLGSAPTATDPGTIADDVEVFALDSRFIARST